MAEMNRFEMLAPRAWLDRVDAWRVKQPGIPSRGEAVRRLVERALETKSQ
jgi:metal-responsive CopG/Arc/MetJ family transcriptional regulator